MAVVVAVVVVVVVAVVADTCWMAVDKEDAPLGLAETQSCYYY